MKTYQNELKVVALLNKGVLQTECFAETAWNFAATTLWNDLVLSQKEIEEAKLLIRDYLLMSDDLKRSYLAFCQRVLLAHQYLKNASNRFVPLPSTWLQPENLKGFAGTKQWYEKIIEVRRSLPDYRIEWKALAEAVWELGQEPTLKNFQYWRNYFIERKTPGLLSLFLNTIANQQFQTR